MKKRILSILLTICMLFCLTPISVFAEEVGTEGSAAIQLGADALSVLSKNVNTATAPTVYFGQNHDNNPAAWRVIGYDGSGVASSHGDITMLAANNMGLSKFGASNAYADSALKEAIDALADKLTAKETDAVEKRTLASGNYDGENTDGVAGPAVSNAVFWPLSSKEANAVNNDLRVVDPEHPGWASSYWWLRSPDEDDSTAYVAGRGEVRYYGGYSTSKEFGVRPAFDLNLDSVLFASAAVGGKPDGGLQPVSPNYTGNEWKLTLYDSKRNNFSRTTWEVSASTKGGTVEISYTDAKTGANEYISALIFDDVGNVIYYGRSNASLTEKDGTAQLTIPAGFAEGTYTLEVFNEQYNGDRKTDLASGFADVTLTVEKRVDEQFTLTPGGRYYFDLSAMDIPGTVNSTLDGGTQTDGTLHYVPFTYVGTVDAYSLDSAADTDTTSYEHSLFIANYNVTHFVSWDALDKQGLIFGKTYSSGSIDYTMRAPSAGTAYNGHYGESGIPANNEWDTILKKSGQDSEDNTTGYIKNWWPMASWGQDTWSNDTWSRTLRGYTSAHFCYGHPATGSIEDLGFRPVLEVLNPDTLSSDGLKVVTLDLGGGTLDGSSEDIQIIVKSSESFAAPASDGMTRPDGNTGSYFMWLGSNGKLYAPGASVPADVTKLTAQFVLSEQFSLTPGGRYYFDLSAMDIPGTVNSNLPDSTLHYVPFTYVGTVNAYSLKNEADNDTTSYEHSLFIADYNMKCSLQRETLAEMNLIYGQTYTASNVNYTLRAPSVGDHHRNEGEGSGLAPIDNEWDTIYQKSADYIKNWYKMRSFGQDIGTGNVEGWYLSRGGHFAAQATFWARPTLPERDAGFRPVLEVLNPDTLGADGMKVVTLDLNGGTLGGSSDAIHIIVKTGSAFTAPASDGMTRPDGDTGSYFMWLDGNGNSYEPGGSVPADVTELTAQWTAPTYAVTLNTNGGTINSGNVTGYTYGVGATLPAADDMTYTGHTFKGWYDNENLTGSPVTAIGGAETGNKEYWAKWEINQYTITFDTNGGSEIAPITQDYGTEITAPDNPTRKGYTFKGWDKEIPETMPAENITITARWRDTEKPTGEIIIGTNKWNEFLNKLTFGIFFKDTQEVTINAVDNSGVVFVSYLVTDKELSEAELNSLVFRAYEEPFRIDPNGEYIIYVMLVDENINITYLRSDRLTLDNIQPVISGIENGKTYCEAQTVTVDEKNVDTVTVNGTAVTLDADGGFVLPPTNGEQKIVVTDKAGNNAEMTVTVNNGHTFGEWVSDNDGKHTRKCTVDGCDAVETENCSGGNATCTEKAVCDVCGKAYGEFDVTNHKGGVQEWTTRTAFNHEQKWNCCGAVIVASEAHEWKDGVCRECGYVCLHNDTDKNHICDYCEKTISEHEDADKNHICDYCEKIISEHEDKDKNHICDYCEKIISEHEDKDKNHICDYCKKTISEHVDKDKNHICDYCEKTISEHEDKDKNHICDYCKKTISEHEDADKDHICDYCKKTISAHEDADKNHICDYCGKGITNHSGGKATCTEKAVCEICNEPYGEIDGASHADLRHIEAKTATKDAEGNVEYWYCEACNKYYSDEAATKEIKKTDTVTAKLPDSSKSPQTGNNGSLMLWIALLFISGGVMKGVTAFDKLKKHSAKIKDK